MVQPIFIDTQSITDQFYMDEGQVNAFMDFVVKDVAASFARRWEDEAKSELKQTRSRYVRALSVVDSGRLEASVILDYSDPVVRMVEEGAGAFDMKPGFASSSKKKRKKDGGWYMHIPFRVATPDAVGESDVFSDRMDDETYAIAKKLEPESLDNRSITQAKLPEHLKTKGSRPAITNLATNKTFEKYEHKTSKAAGITKVKDSVTGQNKYMKFRTVSDNSDADAFVHTGILAHNLAEKAMSELETTMQYELNDATNRALAQLGF